MRARSIRLCLLSKDTKTCLKLTLSTLIDITLHQQSVPRHILRSIIATITHTTNIVLSNGVSKRLFYLRKFTFFFHVRMFLEKQPAHVSEEETTTRVVRVGISFRILVMYTMVTAPFVNIILQRHGIGES